MEGFYKLDENGSWLFAPSFVYAKDYVLEKDGNREEVDGGSGMTRHLKSI